MEKQIKIIIADDHEIFRTGFQVLLSKQKRVIVIGEAENGNDLIEKVALLKPDIVITDIQMPLLDGIEATRVLNKLNPNLGIIALTMFNDDYLIIDMLEAGARGYLLKNTNKKELLDAIDAVYHGSTYYCDATSVKLTTSIALSNVKQPAQQIKNNGLNSSEIEIIKLICQEFSSKQIAGELGYSKRTIENYREKIQDKVGAKNVVGIVVYAIKNKIFCP